MSLIEQTKELYEQLGVLKRKCNSQELLISKLEAKIEDLKHHLKENDIKLKFCKLIIEEKFGKSLNDYFEEKEDCLCIYNQQPKILTVKKYKGSRESATTEEPISVKKLTKSSQPGALPSTTVSALPSVVVGPPAVGPPAVGPPAVGPPAVGCSGSGASAAETIEQLKDQFSLLLPSNKALTENQLVTERRRKRTKLLSQLSLEEYVTLLKSEETQFQQLLITKSCPPVRTKTLNKIFFSPLEQRLLFRKEFSRSDLDMNDVCMFEQAIRVAKPSTLTAFDFSIVNSIKNYSLCLFPLSDLLKKIITHGNIVFFRLNESAMFSFYTLDEVRVEKTFWSLDTRLQDFSQKIGDTLRPFMIELYRKVYFDFFGDYTFRLDVFKEKNNICEKDLKQLWKNLVLIAKRKAFCIQIQSIILEFCTRVPIDRDHLNFKVDDEMLRKEFNETEDTSPFVFEHVKELFNDFSFDRWQSIPSTEK